MRFRLLFLFLVGMSSLYSQYKYDSSKIESIRWSPKPFYVQGVEVPELDINDMWEFAVIDTVNISAVQKLNFQSITVPGEWVMQGFKVEKDEFGVYRRELTLPSEMKGKSLKLRFEAVYSQCEIWLNGKKIGTHHTGFTAFEIEIKKYLLENVKNELLVFVNGSSTADNLSSASSYAVHYLGGISRDVSILVLPNVQLSSFHSHTIFDKAYVNATLRLDTKISNETLELANVQLVYRLKNAEGKLVKSYKENKIAIGSDVTKNIVSEIKIEKPTQWNPEEPYLYTVEVELIQGTTVLEKANKKIGFKQTEIKGNEVYVNNKPIKLRGVNRHEVDPKTGRVLRGEQWYNDVQIFKQGNVNYIRTSHYPPSEKFLEACDELGMFVEVEAPFCWASKKHVNDTNYFNQMIRPTLEMVEMLKSHVSILHWSVGNESFDFKELFRESARLVKIADPSRPRIFSQWGPDADLGDLEITNHHYPGTLEQIGKYKNYKRPIIFDEYIHLNAYNRKELATDPGLRDFWGLLFYSIWEKMYETPGVLGGAIWAGIDDSFFLPSGNAVGYGTWGPIDGWRREKPEYWHMKKVYSPVKISFVERLENGISILIKNRNIFTNTSQYKISWITENEEGVLKTDIASLSEGMATISLKKPTNTGINIEVHSMDSNYLIDKFHFNLSNEPKVIFQTKKRKLKVKTKGEMIRILDKELIYTIDKVTGVFRVSNSKMETILSNFPALMILPITGDGGGTQMTEKTPDFSIFSEVCKNRVVTNVVVSEENENVKIVIEDSYLEAVGKQILTISTGGTINIEYFYKMNQEINPRQIGLVFQLPSSFNRLEWSRNGFWSVYPENHIGRLNGTATTDKTVSVSGLAGPSEKPTKDWLHDRTASGSNDFRATKRNIYKASLSNKIGSKFSVDANGFYNLRAWETLEHVKVLIVEYDNPGGERFLRTYGKSWDKKLKRGSEIKGVFTIKLK